MSVIYLSERDTGLLANTGLFSSVVELLRWDPIAMFEAAAVERVIALNPAARI
jgi:hypothetical protein